MGRTDLRTQVLLRDLTLLFADVSTDFENFHSIKKGSRDGVEGVGRAHKENAGEVDGKVEAGERVRQGSSKG